MVDHHGGYNNDDDGVYEDDGNDADGNCLRLPADSTPGSSRQNEGFEEGKRGGGSER